MSMGRTPTGSRPVVVTTDCGADMDDQWAIAHLALSPAIDVRGVVTTHAPNLAHPAAETAARCAAEVFNHLPIQAPPDIVAGSSLPLSDRAPKSNPGTDRILREADDHSPDARLVVLALGAATNIASALLIDPTVVDRIEIVAMGFDGWPEGGDGFNVRNDLLAWQIVLESSAPITVGDAAVTKRDLIMSAGGARQLFEDSGPAGVYLTHLSLRWLEAEVEVVRAVTGDGHAWPIWDEVTVAHLLGLTSSGIYPRPTLRADLSFRHPEPACGAVDRTIRWIHDVDTSGLWQHLRGLLREGRGA
jgi:inosine-uridine nucleoside N-ribohydrolase